MVVVHQKVPKGRANNLNNLQQPIRRIMYRRTGEDLHIFPRSQYPPNPPQSNQAEDLLRGHDPEKSRRRVPELHLHRLERIPEKETHHDHEEVLRRDYETMATECG